MTTYKQHGQELARYFKHFDHPDREFTDWTDKTISLMSDNSVITHEVVHFKSDQYRSDGYTTDYGLKVTGRWSKGVESFGELCKSKGYILPPQRAIVPRKATELSVKMSDRECAMLFQKAHDAGMLAGQGHHPAPMVVYSEARLFDNSGKPQFINDGQGGLIVAGGDNIDHAQPVYTVNEGVCGFAWINVKPGNCSFANWLKRTGKGRSDSYYHGVSIWVTQFNQSYERKRKYAGEFARVLSEAGIKAYSMDRLD